MPKTALSSISRALSRPLRSNKLRLAPVAVAAAATVAVAGCTPPAPPATGAVLVAQRQAGKPYVWGATGPSSFDCSGLTQYSYAAVGKFLPRTTDQQYAASIHLPRGSEQPGDLIFFGSPGAIYHEGIYAGGGQIWHAPKPGGQVELIRIWDSGYLVGRV